jgi:hypothetical protein
MNFVKIEIVLPSEVDQFYQRIQTIDPRIFIAGGFVFDLLDGKPYKDVDIFVPREIQASFHSFLQDLRLPIKVITNEYYERRINGSAVFEFYYKNIRMNAVFTDKGIDELLHFDIRMRAMYYQNGQAYASSEALEDMANRTIHVGSVDSPLLTFYRVLRFKKKYGYKVDKPSVIRLFEGLSAKNQKLRSYIPNNLTTGSDRLPAKKELQHILSPYKNGTHYVLPKECGQDLTVPIDLITAPSDVRSNMGEQFTLNTTFTMTENPYVIKAKEVESDLLNLYRDIRLKLMLNDPSFVDPLDAMDDTSLFLYTVLPHIVRTYRGSLPSAFVGNYKTFSDKQLSLGKEMSAFDPSSPLTITNEFERKDHLPLCLLDEYEEHQLFKVQFSYGSLLFSKKQDTLHNVTVPSIIFEWLQYNLPTFIQNEIQKTLVQ